MDELVIDVVGALFAVAFVNVLAAGWKIDAGGRRERSLAGRQQRTRSRPLR